MAYGLVESGSSRAVCLRARMLASNAAARHMPVGSAVNERIMYHTRRMQLSANDT